MERKSPIQTLARRWWIGLLVLLITVGVTAYLTSRQAPRYDAKVTYVTKLNETITSGRDITSAVDALNRQPAILTTYSEVAKSQIIKNRAAQTLGFFGNELRRLTVNSRVIAGTNMLEISVEGESPVLVRDYANALGAETSSYANSLYTTYQLDLLDEAQLPNRPVSPNLTINLIAGTILGLFLGFTAMLLSVWLTGAFRESSVPAPDNEEVLTAVENQIEELKQQSSAIRKELDQARTIFHDTLMEAKVLNDTLHRVNGQLQK